MTCRLISGRSASVSSQEASWVSRREPLATNKISSTGADSDTASSGLGEEEVDQLVAEAQEQGDTDQLRRQRADLENKADGLIYSTRKTLDEFADNVVGEDREALLQAIEAVDAAMKGEDLGVLRGAVDELSALTYNMTEKLYAALGENDEVE